MSRIIRLILQVVLLPIRLPLFLYHRFRGRHRLNWIIHELKGEMSDGPVTRNFLQYFKEFPLKFYEILLGIDRLSRFQQKVKKARKKVHEFTVIIHDVRLSWSQAWEYREALKLLKKNGIITRVFLLTGAPYAYYIATAADKIYLPPAGQLVFTGIRAEPLYFKTLLSKLAVQPDFVTIGKFKSAPERYTANKPSKESVRQIQEITETIYLELLKAIAQRLDISEKEASVFFKQALLTAKQAKEKKLVDEILYPQELEELIKKENEKKCEDAVTFEDALHVLARKQVKLFSLSVPERLALVVAEGAIMHSKDPNPRIISYLDYHTHLASLKDAGFSGVILRINSPGGAADVSDLLWKDLMSIRERPAPDENDSKPKKQKPLPEVYVSQSSVAASGGYYLSAISSKIFATPLTITGSIGVFAGKFNISGLMKKTGISNHAIASGENSDLFSGYRPFSAEQKKILKTNMQSMYELFIDRICKGRGKTPDSIYPFAEGRVFTGEAALKNKLVDYSGGLLAVLEKFRADKNIGSRPVYLTILPQVKTSILSRPPLGIPGMSVLNEFTELLKPNIWFIDPRLL